MVFLPLPGKLFLQFPARCFKRGKTLRRVVRRFFCRRGLRPFHTKLGVFF